MRAMSLFMLFLSILMVILALVRVVAGSVDESLILPLGVAAWQAGVAAWMQAADNRRTSE